MITRKLGRESSHRRAMMRNLATDLFNHEKITTTEMKAKELQMVAEKLVTLAKKGDLSARRRAAAVIDNKDVVKKLFDEIAKRYTDRNGGYTRIMKLGPRRGDAAPMALVELVK